VLCAFVPSSKKKGNTCSDILGNSGPDSFFFPELRNIMTFHISFGEIDVVVLHYRVPDGAGAVHVNFCYKVNLEAGSLLDWKSTGCCMLPLFQVDWKFLNVF
jgi:hypothetical protein